MSSEMMVRWWVTMVRWWMTMVRWWMSSETNERDYSLMLAQN